MMGDWDQTFIVLLPWWRFVDEWVVSQPPLLLTTRPNKQYTATLPAPASSGLGDSALARAAIVAPTPTANNRFWVCVPRWTFTYYCCCPPSRAHRRVP
ncbi:hypothetical protein AAHA92_06719 [Salvia divinorum]|uniref:Secreted protein n=1 Tax=Salvia divinorum TaxID=28513 RepID=A0ABD1I6L2_SALDI